MNLEEVQENFELPDGLIPFCEANGLWSIDVIRRYEEAFGTFMALPGCTEIIEDRLLGLLTIIPPPQNTTSPEAVPGLRRDSSDLTLEEISQHYGLSARARNVCEAAELVYLSDLRDFAERHGDFRKLRNCGNKTQLELIALMAKFQQQPDPWPTDPDLNALTEHFNLSARARNVCENADLHRLSEIRAFAREHDGFRGLRNCGKKTELELNDLMARSIGPNTPAMALPGPQVHGLAEVIKSFVLQISGPARSVLRKHAKSIKPGAVFNFLGIHDRRMPKFPGAKGKVKMELVELRRNILNAMQHFDAPASPERERQLWCLRHQVNEELATVLFNDHGQPALLRFLDQYLQQVVRARALSVYSPLIKGAEPTGSLEEIARSAGLTRERVRQMMILRDRWILGNIALVEDLPEVRAHYAELCTEAGWLLIPPDLAMGFNQREGTEWSPRFFGYLAQVLNGHRIKLARWESLFDRRADSRRLDHLHPLLVADQLAGPLHMATQQALVLFNRKRGREEEVSLSALPHQDGLGPEEQIMDILRKILPLRFPGSRVIQDAWVIPPNARLKQEEILEEVLAMLNEPSHASRIAEEWNTRYPDHPINVEGIRSVAVRNKDKFFSVGRTSTYGLRQWEAERPVKGGTIRDLVEDLLNRREGPIHLSDALDEVLKYRPSTNLNSMRQNLKLEESGRFQFMKDGYIGLAGKVYEDLPVKPAISGSLFQAKVLAKFIGKPREALVAFITSRTDATAEQVGQKINGIISSGRLLLSPSGIITSVRGSKTGEGFGELPMDW